MEFRGLQIYNNKSLAEEALKKRKQLTKVLEEKRAKSMEGNKRAVGNSGGDQSNLVQYSSEVQKLKNAKTDALVMHPGPINRDVEIESSLADDINKSVINEQVENGVAVRMACLSMLIN